MIHVLPFILITVAGNAIAQVLLKSGMTSVGGLALEGRSPVALFFQVLFNPFVFVGLCTYIVAMGAYLFVLSRVDVSFAFPFLSLAYVLVAIYAYLFMNETMSFNHIAGIGLIVLGTVVLSLKSTT